MTANHRRTDADRVAELGSFALCLTHDVDRPYKSLQAPYYAVRDRRASHLKALRPDRNPWWLFDEIADLEDDLDVRSAFYFLSERHLLERPPEDWLSARYWIEHLGRYDPASPEIASVIRRLDRGGWEVGLHGSYDSYCQPERLRKEKAYLESVLGHEVVGGRQHYLNLDAPRSWRYHADVGLSYDASLGSSSEYGFRHGYHPRYPFDDEFAVFPLTIMEKALPDLESSYEAAKADCERLLREAAEHGAVMSVLWHPRYFCEEDFPGHRSLYRWLIERALELDAWVGAPADLYRRLRDEDASSVASGAAR